MLGEVGADVGLVRVRRDDDVDPRVERLDDRRDVAGQILAPVDVGEARREARVRAGVRERRVLLAALVQEHHERPHALVLTQLRDECVHRLHLGTELEALHGRRRHDQRRPLERETDERDLRVVDPLDLVRGKHRVARAGEEDVRREVAEQGTAEPPCRARGRIGRHATAVLHAVELLQPLVELVVADARDLQAEGVHRLDRRLVVEQPRDQRARADQVSRADGDRVRVVLAQLLDERPEVLDPPGVAPHGDLLVHRRVRVELAAVGDRPGRVRLQMPVEVVDREQLDVRVPVFLRPRARRRRRRRRNRQ